MTPHERLQAAFSHAFEHRPKIGGFPFLAECLRKAGVQRNLWVLPAAQSTYVMQDDVIVQPGTPLETAAVSVPVFNEAALITALRTDQEGRGTFPDFLQAAWRAGVVRYDVDLEKRTVAYFGIRGECYTEAYPSVDIGSVSFA